jgi:HSP20 family protein
MYTANLNHLLDLFEKDLPKWSTTTTFNESPLGYIKQHDDSYQLAFDVVGHSKESINIDVEGNLLKIKAETKLEEGSILKNLVSTINHSIRISNTYDITQTSAEVENGILLISIPKKEEAKQKKISVKVK